MVASAVSGTASDGDLVGTIFLANNSTAGDQRRSSVSVGPQGEFLVGWLDDGQGGTRVMVERFTADNPSVGIKAAGPQIPWSHLLPLWVDGSVNPFVGSGMSTKILVVDPVRQPVFAVDVANNEIHQLDPDSAAIVHSIPLPEPISGDAGLAFAGNTLYLVSDTGIDALRTGPRVGRHCRRNPAGRSGNHREHQRPGVPERPGGGIRCGQWPAVFHRSVPRHADFLRHGRRFAGQRIGRCRFSRDVVCRRE